MADQQPVNLSSKTIQELAETLRRTLTPLMNMTDGQQRVDQPKSKAQQAQEKEVKQATKTIAQLTEESNELKKNLKVLNKLLKSEVKAGNESRAKSIESQISKQNEEIKQREETIEAIKKGTAVTKDNIDARVQETKAVKQARENLLTLAKSSLFPMGVMGGVRSTIDDYRKALETGLDLNYMNNALLGVSQQESLDFIKRNRLIARATEAEGSNFVDVVNQLQNDLFAYVGTSQGALELAGAMQRSARMIGLSGSDLSSFINDGLSQSFKQLNSNLSVTASEFQNITNMMFEDQDIRGILIRAQGRQRAEFAKGTMEMFKFFRTITDTDEAAMGLTKALMGPQQDPKELIKQTYKLAAMGQMLGVDMTGFVAAQFTPAQMRTEAQQQLIAERSLELARRRGEVAGRGLPDQLAMAEITKGMGLENYFRTFEDASLRQQGIGEITVKSNKERNKTLVNAVQGLDAINSTLKSGFAQVLGSMALMALSRGLGTGGIGPSLSRYRGAMGGGISGTAGKASTRLMRGIPIAGSALMAMMALGQVDDIGWNKQTVEAGGGLAGGLLTGAAAGALFGGPVGALIGGTIGAIIGQVAGEKIAGTVWDVLNKDEPGAVKNLQVERDRLQTELEALKKIRESAPVDQQQVLSRQITELDQQRKRLFSSQVMEVAAAEDRLKMRKDAFAGALKKLTQIEVRRDFRFADKIWTPENQRDFLQKTGISAKDLWATSSQVLASGEGRWGKGITDEEKKLQRDLISTIAKGEVPADPRMIQLFRDMLTVMQNLDNKTPNPPPKYPENTGNKSTPKRR